MGPDTPATVPAACMGPNTQPPPRPWASTRRPAPTRRCAVRPAAVRSGPPVTAVVSAVVAAVVGAAVVGGCGGRGLSGGRSGGGRRGGRRIRRRRGGGGGIRRRRGGGWWGCRGWGGGRRGGGGRTGCGRRVGARGVRGRGWVGARRRVGARGAGTPATAVGPEGGRVSVVEMGLMDWISPPTPATTGKPPVGVGGWDEAPEDPGGGVPRLPLPPDLISGEEVSGDSFSAAPATAPPKLVHPGVQGLWSLRPNTSSRPMRATTVAAQARARRRSDGRQLIR